jgi:hypothetical protein
MSTSYVGRVGGKHEEAVVSATMVILAVGGEIRISVFCAALKRAVVKRVPRITSDFEED